MASSDSGRSDGCVVDNADGHFPFILVGGGIAGVTCAEMVRELDTAHASL